MVEQIPHVKDVRDDYVEGLPSVLVRIDRQKAAIFGPHLLENEPHRLL